VLTSATEVHVTKKSSQIKEEKKEKIRSNLIIGKSLKVAVHSAKKPVDKSIGIAKISILP
jgi:hypothetical protein